MFPQLKGLGMSSTSMYYGIGSLAEARAYLAHPELGPRLKECVRLLLDAPGSAADILGPDDVKLRSSLTLFIAADPTSRCSRRRWSVSSTACSTTARSRCWVRARP